MKTAWVAGWAVPEAWLDAQVRRAWPQDEPSVFPSTPGIWAALESAGPFERLAGYSLGALLLLSEPARANRAARQVRLFAPIWAFAKEADAGGRVPRAELRALKRALRAHPREALRGFYAKAGLEAAGEMQAVPATDGLLWGLEQLDRLELKPALPPGWQAWCGADDALLDAARLKALVPSLSIVPGATHHPAALFAAAGGAGGVPGASAWGHAEAAGATPAPPRKP